MMNKKRSIPDISFTSKEAASLSWPIWRVREGEKAELDDRVVREEPLEIVVNKQRIAVLMRMPGQEKELAAGFCISEGYVRRAADFLYIRHCGSGNVGLDETKEISRNRVVVKVHAPGFFAPGEDEVVRLIRSGCGAAEASVLSETLPMVTHQERVSAAMVLRLERAMRDHQKVHHHVGGTHSAALFDAAGQIITLAEDIGRHNAVDKILGHCLLRDIFLENKILVTSGRISYEMVIKAIRTNIPVIASFSSPTSLAVQLAQDRNVTLIGYLRGKRMNIYTHAKWLKIE